MTTPTALLIHSGGFTSRQWRRLAEALAPGFHVLAPDLLGYGAAEPWAAGKPFHFRQDLQFLESLLAESAGPVDVIGHSYGGFLALQLALLHPELIRSIAVYDPVAFGVLDSVDDADARQALDLVRHDWQPDASGADEAWLSGFVDWWNGPGAWTRLPAETRASFRAVGWKVFQEVVSLVADQTDRVSYATIKAPTLLMSGDQTPLTERRVVERLGTALPQATVEFFHGAGHMGPISHMTLVNAAIIAHLDANAGR